MNDLLIIRRRQLVGICLGAGLSWFFFSIHDPLLQIWLIKIHRVTPATLGSALSLAAIASVIVTLPGGWLVQRYGTRLILAAATFACGLGFGLFLLSGNLLSVVLVMCLVESGKVLVFLSAQAHIANHAIGESASDFGWYGASAALGQILGPVVSGFLLDHGTGFYPIWLALSIGSALVGLAYWKLIDPGAIQAKLLDSKRPPLKTLFSFEANVAMAASFAIVFAVGARANFYIAFLHEHAFSLSAIGILVATRPMSALLSRLFMGSYIRLCGGNNRALAVSLLIMAAGLLLTPAWPTFWFQFFTGLLVGVGVGIAMPLSMASVSSKVSPALRGYALGVRLTGNRAAQVANPLFFGRVGELAGLSGAFIAGGFFLLALCVPAFCYASLQNKAANLK